MKAAIRAWWERHICEPTTQRGYLSRIDMMDGTRHEEDWDS